MLKQLQCLPGGFNNLLCILERQLSFILLEERAGEFLWWLIVYVLIAYQHYYNVVAII